MITTISAVLNLYWDLVSFNHDVRIKEQALATAQRLYEDNQKRVQAGSLPAVEVTRAAAQVSANEEALLISRTNLAQQETVLKNALSRTGVEDPKFDAVHVVTLDSIEIPKTEEIRADPGSYRSSRRSTVRKLNKTRISLENSKINLQGHQELNNFAEFERFLPS